MAIRNPLNNELNTINERIRKRENIGTMVGDELFGLLKNEPNKRIIIDTTFNQGFQDIRTNITEINTRLNDINTNLLPTLNTNITTNEGLLNNRDVQSNTAIQTTIQNDANIININNQISTTETEKQNFIVYDRTLNRLNTDTTYQVLVSEIQQIDADLRTTLTNDERKGLEARKKTETSKEQQMRQDIKKEVERELQVIKDRLVELKTQKDVTIQNITNNQKTIRQANRQATEQELTKWKTERDKLQTERDNLQNVLTSYNIMLNSRTTELTDIQNIINNFDIQSTINGQTTVLGGGITPIVLQGIFATNNNNMQINYELCNNDTGEPIKRQGNNIEMTLKNGQNITITGLQIQNNEIICNNIQIQPIDNIQFPVNLQLAVRGRHQEIHTGIEIDHYKTLTITINSPQLPLNERQLAYNDLNQGGTVNTRLAAEYSDPNRTTVENEVIREILRANGNQAEIDKIYNNQQQRDLLIQRIRNIPNLIPVFNIAQLQGGFMNEMTRLNRNIPVQYLVNRNAFTDYLRNNLEENVRNFVRGEIRTAINTTAQRNNILRMVMDFQTDIINDKLDNNDHRTLDQNVPNLRPQGHPNTRRQRILRRRSNKNNRTKFLDGKESKAFEDKLETNEGELGFDLKVAVHGVNKIVTTINIRGEEEPIVLDTRDVNEMTHMILRLEATKNGEPINRKLRCRMAMNAIKAVVSMSPVTLHRQYQGNITAVDGHNYQIDRLSTHIRGGNLIVRGSCAASHNNPQAQPPQYRQRINHVVFDEQRYKGLHNINELERGMVTLSGQINDIMDAMGNEFREATSRIKAAPLMRYNTRYYLRGGPVKRLRGRLFYGKTNRKFNFDTTATSGSKTVNIKFEKGKFILSGTFKDKPYEFKGRSLGLLLRKKMDRLRVFDGVELPIFEKINEEMVKQLRTNNFIGPENFGISDLNQDKTGRVYVMDSHGDLSYIEIEDRNLNPLRNGRTYGCIDFDDLPPQRIRCNEQERREFMQNPLLSGRLIRAMRGRLHLV